MRAVEIPDFERLSDLERVALAEDILASLRDAGALPAPIAHKLELDRRWADYKSNPASALSKEQFHSQVAAAKR